MKNTSLTFLSYAVSWAVIMGGVWALFDRAENTASKIGRIKLAKWLKSIDPLSALRSWPKKFAEIFDLIFGERHLSFRCFRRSIVVSTIFVTIILLFWISFRTNEFLSLINHKDWWIVVIAFFFSVGFLNIFIDYISLLETRYIIKLMSKSNSIILNFIYLIIDILVTGLIWIIIIVLFVGLLNKIIQPIDENPISFSFWLKDFFKSFPNYILMIHADLSPEGIPTIPDAVLFYSTYFTSVWIWIYLFSLITVKLGKYFKKTVNFINIFLDVDISTISHYWIYKYDSCYFNVYYWVTFCFFKVIHISKISI